MAKMKAKKYCKDCRNCRPLDSITARCLNEDGLFTKLNDPDLVCDDYKKGTNKE